MTPFDSLPKSAHDALNWGLTDFTPFYDDLLQRPLTAETLDGWMTDWSNLTALGREVGARLNVATTLDTNDEDAQQRFFTFVEHVGEKLEALDTQLMQKFVEAGLEPPDFAVPLRHMRSEIALFREENMPLLTELTKIENEYDQIIGNQRVVWEGEEVTATQLNPKLLEPDRAIRERAWRAIYERKLQDREALNALWGKMLQLRIQVAKNADKPDYRAYMWSSLGRHDYTPEDNMRFLNAIEQVVVPAATRLLERRKQQLGLDALRPWDMALDPANQPPLKPFQTADELISGGARIFSQLDPQLSGFYSTMQTGNLLDLDNRPGKAPGGYCVGFDVEGTAFIFMNAVGIHDDVQTLLHESGHAFHNFLCNAQPYVFQRDYPIEFAEVASMSMELIGAPYLDATRGGFYTPVQAARAQIEHLEGMIRFWPYMAVVDSFQQWAYTHTDDAADPAKCDATWNNLWDRFMPGVDWSGIEQTRMTGWHRKLHIFTVPFYYVEYGLAQLGAAQVWRNALQDPVKALEDYRAGLALGNTRTLPELFEAAGAKLAFDADLLGDMVSLIERRIHELEQVQ